MTLSLSTMLKRDIVNFTVISQGAAEEAEGIIEKWNHGREGRREGG